MKVELAESAGFCFGAKRAVDSVYRLAEKKDGKVYTLGPIIHNEQVVEDLEKRGVQVVEQIGDLPEKEKATLVIRSHGVAKPVLDELDKMQVCYEDATCPFVKKIYAIVSENSSKGYAVIIIGTKSHPEVQGILGWVNGTGVVIENREEAESFELEQPGQKVCVVAQTTFNYKKFQELVEIISKKGYDILAVNTICNATSTRQQEAEKLAARSDAMLVIGGMHSSNSRKLYEICKNQCENTFFIQTVDDLGAIPLSSFTSLGITAGASTPNNIIQEVLEACQRI